MQNRTATELLFHFQSLLPDVIISAIESVGLCINSGLTELNSYENRVFQFIDEENRRWVVKFYRPERWSSEQILEEHAFSAELLELEIPIVAPAQFNQQSLHVYQGFMFALFPSMGGRPYEGDNEDHLAWVGRFLGRIHQVGAQRPFQYRPTVALDEYLYQSQHLLLQSELIPENCQVDFAAVLNDLIQATAACWRSDWAVCRLHGDCHAGNILWRDGPLFVDLDDARNGPAVQDLWMLLQGSQQEQLQQLDILLEAYSEFHDINAQELTLIEPLRSMRMIYYLAWVTKRWQDAAFPRSFPWMSEASFWQTQLSVFAQQIERLQAPPLKRMSIY